MGYYLYHNNLQISQLTPRYLAEGFLWYGVQCLETKTKYHVT